jgi:hypothetical protein
MSDIENIPTNETITQVDNEPIKRGRGRPKKDVTIPIDKEYFKNYYWQTCANVICPNCGAESNKRNLATHKKSMKCQFTNLKKSVQN